MQAERLLLIPALFALLALTGCPGFDMSSTANDAAGASTSGGGTGTGSSGGSSATSGGSGATGGTTATSGSASGGSTAPTAYQKLPDTSQGDSVSVYAISDQPQSGMPSDPLARFAAAHFAGVQKMRAAAKAAFAAYNPNWVQLHYRLGAASGPADFIHKGNWGIWAACTSPPAGQSCGDPILNPSQWSGDWFSFIPSNHAYFLRDASLNLSTFDGTDEWYAHNLTNTAMQSWWINQTITDLQDSASDMVFGDSFNGVIGCAMTNPASGDGSYCDSRLSGTGASDAANWAPGPTYSSQLNSWMVAIQTAFHQQSGVPLFIPNLGSLNTEWFFNTYDFADADGAFLEGFPEQNESTVDNTDYLAADNYALQLTARDKVVIIQSYIDPSNTDERMFCVGTYLLIKGKRTFLNMVGGAAASGFFYWPEYTVKLGSPLSPPPATIQSLYSGGVYRRAFANGLVLVNGGPGSVVVTLPAGQTFYQVVASGGGGVDDLTQLDSLGNLAAGFMSLGSNTLSPPSAQAGAQLSMDGWSGAILLYQKP